MSLRIGIAKRVRSIAEIKQDIGHSWNKVYKDKLSSPLSFDSMSAQMLGVWTGISVSLFGCSLCKNHPIVKRGVEDMLSVCRQGFHCLENPMDWCLCKLLLIWAISFCKWIKAVPGENKAFSSVGAYCDLCFLVRLSEFLLNIMFWLCTRIPSSDFYKIRGRENAIFMRWGSVWKSLWLHISACETSDPRGAGGLGVFGSDSEKGIVRDKKIDA